MRFFTFLLCFTLSNQMAVAQRAPDQTLERIYIGLAIGQDAPTGQIAPWDSAQLDTFLEILRTNLDAKIKDPKIRAMANDLTLRELSEGTTHYYQSTFDAFDIIWGGTTQQDYKNALFIFITTAQRGDPFGFEGIESYFEQGHGTLPEGVTISDITRKAADLDLLPALERLTYYWLYDNVPATPETIESYLRYGMDIANDGGFEPIVEKVLDFYIHHHNDRPSDGYAQRALDIYAQYEPPALVEDYRSFMYRYGVDHPQSEKLQLDAAIRAVIDGNDRLRRTIGFMIMDGNGSDMDLDLGRDISFDCFQMHNDASCLANLGYLYSRDDNPNEDFPLTLALYKFAVETDPSLNARHGQYINDLTDYLDLRERRLANLYLDQMRSGDFSDLPDLGDARPVDYEALLAQRDLQ